MSQEKKTVTTKKNNQDDMPSPLMALLSGKAGPLPLALDLDDDVEQQSSQQVERAKISAAPAGTLFSDPWLQKQDEVRISPANAELSLICSYGVYIGIDTVEELAYLRRTEQSEELWVDMEFSGFGCVLQISRRDDGDDLTLCRDLLTVYFRARVGHGWPVSFLEPGILESEDYSNLIEQLERLLNSFATEARRESRTGIIQTADKLDLSPEPTGTGPHHWRARCPGGSHYLQIHSGSNTFGCGYCKCKGGPEDLQDFAHQSHKLKK